MIKAKKVRKDALDKVRKDAQGKVHKWVYAKPLPFPIRANKPLPYIENAHGLIKKKR
jgi:hypothetical protein